MDLHSAKVSMQESEFPEPLNGFVLSGNEPVLFASANEHVLPTRTSEHLLHAHEFMVPIPDPLVINSDHSSSVNSHLLHEPQTERVLPVPHNAYLPLMNENEHLLPIAFSEHMSPMLANEHMLPTALNDHAFTVPMRNFALPVSQCEPELPSSTSEPVLLVPACDPFNTRLDELVPTLPLNEFVLLASSNEHMLPQPMTDYVLPVASVDPVLHTPILGMIDPVHHMPVNRPVLYEPTHYGEPLLHTPMHQNEPLLPVSTHQDGFALHVPKYCHEPVLLAHQDEIMYTPMIDAGNFPSSSTASLSPYDSSVENTARCAEENTEDTFEENIEQSIEENIEQSTEENKEHSTVGSKLGSIANSTEESSEHSTVGSELGSTADSTEESTEHCKIGTELQSLSEDNTEESTEHSTIGSELESTVNGTVDGTEENTDCTEESNESEISMQIVSSYTCTSQLLSSPDRTLPLPVLIAESVLPTTIQPSSFSSQQPKSYTTLVSMKASNTQPSKSNTPLPSRAESAPPSFQPSQSTMSAFPRAESTPPASIWQEHYLTSWTELVPPSFQPEQSISSVPSHVSSTPLSSQPLQPTVLVPAMLSTQSINSQPSQQLKSVSSVIEHVHVPTSPDIQPSSPPIQQPISTNIPPSPLLTQQPKSPSMPIQQPKSPSMPIQQPKSPSMPIQQPGMQIHVEANLSHSSPSVTPTVQPTVVAPSPQHLRDLPTSATAFSKTDQMSPELAIPRTKIPQLPSTLPPPPPILPPPPPPPCPPAPPPSIAPFNVPSLRYPAAQLSNLNSKLMEPIACKDSKMEEQLDSAVSRILFRSDSIGLSCRRGVLPILQDGPCCGIVALVMAGQMLGVDSINVYDALALAKDRNYSKQGEMFSAKNMHLLAKELYPTSNCQLVDNDSPEITVKIIEHLSQGLPILLPYDADKNHEPCQKKGHKAHWALLSGFLGLIDDQNDFALKTLIKDGKISNLYYCKDSKLGQGTLKSLCSDGRLYVYGLQGKSRYTAVWSLDSLLKSNSQLCEVEPERTEDSDSYILPERLDIELCSQMIFLGEKSIESHRMNDIETLNALFSSFSDSLPKAIHLTDTHSEVNFNRKDIVLRNTKGSSEQLTEFWIKVIEICSPVDCLNESETFTCRKNAVTVYVLKRLGTLIIDGNFLLVDVWYREILQTACSMLTRKDQMMNLFTTQDKTDVKACPATPGFEIEEKLDGYSDHLELTSRDGAKSLDNCTSSCECPMSDQLQTLRNACIKDGGTYIYQLWKNLLNKWLSDRKNKVYIATPFLDSGKLKDICKIMIKNQYTANIDKFYVRQKCDDPLYLIDIVRNSTKKFTVAEKMIIKKEVINKMVCDFTSRFHCKFIACVMEDNHAEVLITSANFTRQHFDCSNAESVFYQDMTKEQFQSRFLKPLEAIT